MCDNFAPIAWNGISLSVPGAWQLMRMDSNRLVFEEDGVAVMELKWKKIRGRFSATSHLKRLAADVGRRKKVAFESKPLPAEWGNALEGFEVEGFEWHTRDTYGRGAVLYCPECRTATLIQFFIRDPVPPFERFAAVLDSYRDHRDDGLTVWALFDIRAELPRNYLLAGHAFKPGNFTLALSDRSRSLTLFRWAPAAALIGDRSLREFAATVIRLAVDQFTTVKVGAYAAVQWRIGNRSRGLRLLGRTGGEAPYRQGCIWHIEDRNRILGVSLADKRPLADNQLAEICASYEIVA